MIEIRKKEGETVGSLLFRFNKKIKHSGLMKESRKRRFTKRVVNKNKRRQSTLYRAAKQVKIEQERKHGGRPARKTA